MEIDLGSQWYLFILFGTVGGFASALLGIGGGVVLVPLLMMAVGFDMDHARGTSLAYMVGTALVGAIAYERTHNVDLSLVVILLLTAGGAAGAALGWGAGRFISVDWTKRIFAIVMVFFAVRMFVETIGKSGSTKAGMDNRPQVTTPHGR